MSGDGSLNRLFSKAKQSCSDEELAQIKEAAEFAEEKLRSVVSYDAKEAFSHNVEVAKTAAEVGLGATGIITVLLHNLPYLNESFDEINKKFGKDIARLVKEINRMHIVFGKNEQLTKRTFLSMTKDVGLALIEMVHMLHDLRRLKQLPIERQKRILSIVEEIYIPVAAKLGVYHIKAQYEDLLLKNTQPEAYAEIVSRIKTGKKRRERKVRKIQKLLEKKLSDEKINAKVEGRAKNIHSIYEKMKRKKAKFEEIYDLNAVRVITKSTKDCYRVLGVVHSLWKPLVEEFDDYIAKPKDNTYQSIHTAVLIPGNEPLEIQIRTDEMNLAAEFGIASHWRYKGQHTDNKHDKKFAWMKQLLDWQKENRGAFLGASKAKFFENEIFAITPNGDIIELPEGATALDFAYSIHREIGHHCEKAKVNGKAKPFDYMLESGDQVEIITSERQKPKRNWLNMVKTEKAKNALIKALNIKKIKHGFETKKKEFGGFLSIKAHDKRLRFGNCCSPMPGDEILGFTTTKRKISVHRKGCPELLKRKNILKIDIENWVAGRGKNYSAAIRVLAEDKPGILNELLNVLSSSKTEVVSTSVHNVQTAIVGCDFEFRVNDSRQLEKISERISSIKAVKSVERI